MTKFASTEDASNSKDKQLTPEEIREQEAKKFLRKEEEEICVGYIKHSLSDHLYDLYSTISCPKELWKTLENKYKAEEAGTNKYLISKYLEFQMFPNKPILEQVQNLQVIVNKLKAVGVIIPEIFQVGAIIAKLPSTWKDFSRKMMHKIEDYSMEELQLHLRIEEETHREARANKQEFSVHNVQAVSYHKKFGDLQSSRKVGGLGANKNHFKNKGTKQTKPWQNKNHGKCHVCGEFGHFAKKCNLRKAGDLNMIVNESGNKDTDDLIAIVFDINLDHAA